jgi:hypothetical protein
VRKLVSLLLAVLATCAALNAAPAAAATAYTLSWKLTSEGRFLSKNETALITYDTSPKAAPAPSASAPVAHPCTTKSYTGTYRTNWYTVAERVTNGNMSQKCTVTLAATQNNTYSGSPARVARDYTVLSNETIRGTDASWCVTSCVYVNGSTAAVFRIRANGQCYRTFYNPQEGGSPNHGTFSIVPCPNRLSIDAPTSAPKATSFSVKASSNLGIDVQLSSNTPEICKVTTTDTPLRHTVVGLKAGTCKMAATTNADPGWDRPSTVYDQTQITVRSMKPGPEVLPGDEPDPDPELSKDEPPTARDDAFTYAYGTAYSNNLTANDDMPMDGTTASVTANPASGSVIIDAAGMFVFSPPTYFVGTTSFSYKLTDPTNQSSALATVSITVTAPPPPAAAPTPSSTLSLSGPTWMRLNTVETITARPVGNCSTTPVIGTTCGTLPQSGKIAGSYNRFKTLTVTSFAVTPPNGYPSSRYSLVQAPSVTNQNDPSTAFASGITTKFKFQQATSAGTTFSAVLGLNITWESVQWTRYNGNLVETTTTSGALYTNATTSFGVIGATS